MQSCSDEGRMPDSGCPLEPIALEPMEAIAQHRDTYLGPTEESNWVLPGRLLVGAYPSHDDDGKNDDILRSILSLGVTTFVCLQREYQHDVPEALWRGGLALRPYIVDAYHLLKVPNAVRVALPCYTLTPAALPSPLPPLLQSRPPVPPLSPELRRPALPCTRVVFRAVPCGLPGLHCSASPWSQCGQVKPPPTT